MEQKEKMLGWQNTEKLKEEGRILEAFIILVNWIERNMQFPLYYYIQLSFLQTQQRALQFYYRII